jgi:hypothetical protein
MRWYTEFRSALRTTSQIRENRACAWFRLLESFVCNPELTREPIKMAINQTVSSREAATFRSLLATITGLSEAADLRGDRVSATILLNVAALLAEVQCNHPLTGEAEAAFAIDLSVAA